MQYGLNEEHEMIATTVRSFVENEIYPHEELVEKNWLCSKRNCTRYKAKNN